jgi:hypothetical protein
MIKRSNNQSSIGDVLKEIIQVNKLQTGMDQIAVKDTWKNIMGNGVNYYTREVVLKGNTLYVELTSAVLREELSHGKTKIIAMINEELQREVVNTLVLR